MTENARLAQFSMLKDMLRRISDSHGMRGREASKSSKEMFDYDIRGDPRRMDRLNFTTQVLEHIQISNRSFYNSSSQTDEDLVVKLESLSDEIVYCQNDLIPRLEAEILHGETQLKEQSNGLMSINAAISQSIYSSMLPIMVSENGESNIVQKVVLIAHNECLVFDKVGDTDPSICIQTSASAVNVDMDAKRIAISERGERILSIILEEDRRDVLKVFLVAVASVGIPITLKEPELASTHALRE